MQLGERTHRDIGALQRLDAPDEQQHRTIEWAGRARLRAPAAIARREERVLDSGRDDLDPARGLAVEAEELALLLGAADADRVGAADDLGLGALAPLGLEIAALGLHLGERVERADERQVELVLDAVADEAAEPVVGVQHIGGRVVLDVVDHGVAELVDAPTEAVPWPGRTGRRGCARRDGRARPARRRASPGRVRSRVGRALDAGLRERRHQLAHVHVHAATVARARLGEGRRVE